MISEKFCQTLHVFVLRINRCVFEISAIASALGSLTAFLGFFSHLQVSTHYFQEVGVHQLSSCIISTRAMNGLQDAWLDGLWWSWAAGEMTS